MTLFGTQKQTKKSLASIVAVFTETAEELKVFLATSKDEKVELDSNLAILDNDITKGEATLTKLTDILG